MWAIEHNGVEEDGEDEIDSHEEDEGRREGKVTLGAEFGAGGKPKLLGDGDEKTGANTEGAYCVVAELEEDVEGRDDIGEEKGEEG